MHPTTSPGGHLGEFLEDSSWFRVGNFATFVLSCVATKFVLIVVLLTTARLANDMSFSDRLDLLRYIVYGGYVALLLIVFVHLYFWRAIILLALAFAVLGGLPYFLWGSKVWRLLP